MDDVVANFTVLELEYEGGPVNEKSPNSPEYTYVASAINIALAMLESEQGRDALVDLTVELDNIRPLTLGGPYCHGNVTTSRALDNIFLGKIRAAFPPVVINHTMTNIDVLGTTLSPPWNGSPEDFNPKASMIYLNGSVRVSDMVAAVNQGNAQQFRTFQFLFATTLLHEAGGHMLTSFLLNGRLRTPGHITAPGFGDLQLGESGRWLEMRLFGGTTEYYRDLSHGDQQTGVPHQLDAAGQAWKIHPNTINDACRYRFIFPFQKTGGPIDRLTMRSMGRNPSTEGNSSDQAMRARQIQIYRSVNSEVLEGFTIHLRELRAVPMNPRQQVRVA